jgi:hypothetical protein
MEHLDRLIPLAILGGVTALLLFLLRRTAREKDVAPRTAEAKPAAIPVETPLPIAVPVQIAGEIKRKRRPKRKRAPAVAVQAAPVQTPINTVLGLLKEKDTLAAAFLLREILAPPVSKRQL